MLEVHNLLIGKIAIFVSTVIVFVQTVHTDYFIALNMNMCTLYSYKYDARFFIVTSVA